MKGEELQIIAKASILTQCLRPADIAGWARGERAASAPLLVYIVWRDVYCGAVRIMYPS